MRGEIPSLMIYHRPIMHDLSTCICPHSNQDVIRTSKILRGKKSIAVVISPWNHLLIKLLKDTVNVININLLETHGVSVVISPWNSLWIRLSIGLYSQNVPIYQSKRTEPQEG